jgi:hypothetical protein
MYLYDCHLVASSCAVTQLQYAHPAAAAFDPSLADFPTKLLSDAELPAVQLTQISVVMPSVNAFSSSAQQLKRIQRANSSTLNFEEVHLVTLQLQLEAFQSVLSPQRRKTKTEEREVVVHSVLAERWW